MGLYIEPEGQSKAAFIAEHGLPCAVGEYVHPVNGTMVVAYIQNVHFDAIALIHSRSEAKRFVEGRPDADWYQIPTPVLQPLLSVTLWETLIKGKGK